MKKTAMFMALLFAANTVHAADDGGWKSWYSDMLKGLKAKVEKRLESKTRVSAVAAVRGAKQGGDAKALYWKGGVSEAARKKLETERKQLADAVQLVVDGGLPEGRAALEKFIKDNPESVLLPDAKEALAKLPAEELKKPAEVPAGAGKPAGEQKPAEEIKAPAQTPAKTEQPAAGQPSPEKPAEVPVKTGN